MVAGNVGAVAATVVISPSSSMSALRSLLVAEMGNCGGLEGGYEPAVFGSRLSIGADRVRFVRGAAVQFAAVCRGGWCGS
jgi:hypothetical protein